MKLMLDENISPALSDPLWALGIDTATVRDRGLLSAGDHTIWKAAQSEERSVVTINAGDFRRLARQTPGHAGLIIIPSGSPRDGQFRMIESVIVSVRAEMAILPSLRDRIYEVDDDGAVGIEVAEEPTPMKVVNLRVVKN